MANVKLVGSYDEWLQLHQTASNEGKVVVVDFYATWCGPCRMISPYFEELSRAYTDVVFLKVDVDHVEKVSTECGISAMPTFQVWQNGKKVDELVGAAKDRLKAMIAKHSSVTV